MHLGVVARPVGDVHGHVLRPGTGEAGIRKRQVQRGTNAEIHTIGQADTGGQRDCGLDELRRQVDATDPTPVSRRQVARRPAEARPDIDDMIGGRGRHHGRQLLRGKPAAGVEFVHRREVVDREVVDVYTGLREGAKYPVQQTTLAIVSRNLFGHSVLLPGRQSYERWGWRVEAGCQRRQE